MNEHVAVPADAQATVLLATPSCTVDARCRTVRAGDVAEQPPEHVIVVGLTGEIDLDNADDVHGVIHTLIERGPARIDLDLGRLEFIDSFGISRLMMAQLAAQGAGVGLTIRRAQPRTRKVFAISGLMTFLNVE